MEMSVTNPHGHPEVSSTTLSPDFNLDFLGDDFGTDWSQEHDARPELPPQPTPFGLSNENQPGPATEVAAALPCSISDPTSSTSDNLYLQAANQDITQSPPLSPITTETGTSRCTFCRPQKNRRIEFSSEAALKLHIETDHQFQCHSCPNVGFKHRYRLANHYKTQKHRPKTPGRPSDPCYRCGRCGQFCSHRGNHIRHIQTCKGGKLDQPMSYECDDHGATSVDRNDHVAHLNRCKKKGQKNSHAGRETGSSSGSGSPSSTGS
ncbi:hypothetical protein B0H65DRAFT_212216 [Neurospora tetraspora]|uniref:C2H2-type domain-containing protein n=1 Tax=Neurospora tetraspora TaxID=94610 RepID=A0AAE0JG68_9PEZI|nr:hypothetical protein B0H65DRAFT_212216 [Neurospora tetraspora]